MKVQDLGDSKLERVEFCKRKVSVVPRHNGVYVLSTYCNSILYIGVSKNLQRRMLEHLNGEEKLNPTPQGRAYWFHYKLCSEKESRPDERGWILHHRLHEGNLPYFNKIEAP